MCGFFGAYRACGGVSVEELCRRGARLAHRGPDGAGEWTSRDACAGLAHRRLAILDLSERGHQPMSTPDGRLTLAFNGEIYNFKSLRHELEGLGRAFRSDSDTEVLLAAYAVWGEACLERLRGMFAFAVVECRPDGSVESIFFARDRAGKKPLYYRVGPGRIEFASELKALEGSGSLDLESLNFYLALGYVPAERCLAADVRKLPPAHAARYDASSGRLSVRRYWSLPTQDGIARDAEDLKSEASEVLRAAVETRLHADVPVGIFLSGGFDSALVTAYAARASRQPIHTFSVRMEGSRLDESAQARRIADHFGTTHHELRLNALSLRSLEDLFPFVDEPIGDSSLLPAFQVSRLARQHITVALSGDGGDEVFGGYSDYPMTLAETRGLGWIPEPLTAGLSALAGRLPAGVRGRGKMVSLRRGVERQMAWGTPFFDRELRRRMLGDGAFDAGGGSVTPEKWIESLMVGHDLLDRMTRGHFNSVLPDDFLVKVDRASMANGLEVRCPYLDSELVEFAFGRLASGHKVRDGVTRRLQREIAAELLPEGLDFSRKQGFSIPFDDWLRADSCRWLRRRLESLPAAILRSRVDDLIAGEMAGRANGARLFNLLMLAAAAENMGWS